MAEPVAFDAKWLAGFFDGEGSIGIYDIGTDRTKTIRYYVLRVSLAQSGEVGKMLCGKLQHIFGGTVYKNKDPRVNKEQWKWNISATKAANFLKEIEPYLIIKKKESILAREFQQLASKRTDHLPAKTIAETIKELKVNY